MILIYKIQALFDNQKEVSENISIEVEGGKVIRANRNPKSLLPIPDRLVPDILEPDFEWNEFIRGKIKFSCLIEIFKQECGHKIEVDRMLWRKSLSDYEYIGWLIRPKNKKYIDYLKSIKANRR